MDLLVSHVVLGVIFAASGLVLAGGSRPPADGAARAGRRRCQLARELMASLHRLSVRMAADVDEHQHACGRSRSGAGRRPIDALAAAVSDLVDRLMKANEEVPGQAVARRVQAG